MTDWSKLKVTDLKEECKSRGIALTGLKLKQQYVDKLAEHEAAQGAEDAEEPDTAQSDLPEETQAPTPTPAPEPPSSASGSPPEAKESTVDTIAQVEKPYPDQDLDDTNNTGNKDAGAQDEAAQEVNNVSHPVSPREPAEQDKPMDLQEEDRSTEDAQQLLDTTPVDGINGEEEPVSLSESDRVQDKVDATTQMDAIESSTKIAVTVEDSATVSENVSEQIPEVQPAKTSNTEHIPSDSSTPKPSQIQVTESTDDQKNRRKRSLSPVPTSEEMSRKKTRLSDDANIAASEPVALKEMNTAAETAQEIRGGRSAAPPHLTSIDVETTVEKSRSISPPILGDMSEERDVSPAIHPATSSIYIRNLKRPLHIPTLRNHIVSLAKSPEPITVFFLDSIRTHAFISFTSIVTASRVRTAMHDTRFPDEAMREPLFVDYIPDDKVQSWIDQETGGNSFGGRAGGKRFEVVYEENRQGEIEAIFQEVGIRSSQASFSRPSVTSRTSIDIGRPRLESFSKDVHPERTALVSNHHQNDRLPPSRPSAPSRPANTGVGFKALDELFSSTTTKPKLYFKSVPDAVVQDRLDLLRSLRVDHTEMGRSGDEGMKRYSFEPYKGGREEWVDKGPEFGYGRKGQDRLTGFRGRGGGGYRGRGGDSWRGGR